MCKARYFCRSCHQKRMLAYGEWVEHNVFALPKLLRTYFRHRLYWCGGSGQVSRIRCPVQFDAISGGYRHL